jgi:uncharacterized membrane protein
MTKSKGKKGKGAAQRKQGPVHRARERAAKRYRLRRPQPDWPVTGLALLGMLLTAYLSALAGSGGQAAFCGPESGCALVQQSRWSTLFGLPLALWGFGLYALIAFVAVLGAPGARRWKRLWMLSGMGLVISVYLTAVGWIALGSFCGWCLLSLGIIAAIFGVNAGRRPGAAPGMPWARWLLNSGAVAVFALAVMQLYYSGVFRPPEDPRLRALAEHLEAEDATFFGAFWCSSCQRQRQLFGASAERLPYVECTPDGRNAPTALACLEAGVENYPTWVIEGERHTGVMQPRELARESGFDWSGFTPEVGG